MQQMKSHMHRRGLILIRELSVFYLSHGWTYENFTEFADSEK